MYKTNSNLISHREHKRNFQEVYIEAKNRILAKNKSAEVPEELQLDILDQLIEFEFGRFLLENKGWDGYWTHYVIIHQFTGRKTGLNINGKPFTKLEDFILNKAPIVLATQQRFMHFKEAIQNNLKSNAKIASLPCGLMDDLFTLDYSFTENVTLIGIDLDTNSLKMAAQNAEYLDIKPEVELINLDAWELKVENEYNIITSNGLNIYESDDDKIENLYKIFYNSLKSDGYIVTSCITPPPNENTSSDWLMSEINERDLLLQKVLFMDVIGVEWTAARSTEKTISMLKRTGFRNITTVFDKVHMSPTFTAFKN